MSEQKKVQIMRFNDEELKLLVDKVEISFMVDENSLDREDYEGVVDEANREDFYREYKNIIKSRKKK